MITMDIYGDSRAPHRGDRLKSPKTLYYVLSALPVRRRDPNAVRQYRLRVARAQDLESPTRSALIWSACRRGGSELYEFEWKPRNKKKLTFEQYMRGQRHGD